VSGFSAEASVLIIDSYHVTFLEICLYIWLAAFSYDEFSEFIDAGSIFYAVDIWNGCDVIIILIGAAFLITSEDSAAPAK
jgi:hypothetical protein